MIWFGEVWSSVLHEEKEDSAKRCLKGFPKKVTCPCLCISNQKLLVWQKEMEYKFEFETVFPMLDNSSYCLPSNKNDSHLVTFHRVALSLSNLYTIISDSRCLSFEIHHLATALFKGRQSILMTVLTSF
jgi:hypothetical protein